MTAVQQASNSLSDDLYIQINTVRLSAILESILDAFVSLSGVLGCRLIGERSAS
jgi:hypothetical protein